MGIISCDKLGSTKILCENSLALTNGHRKVLLDHSTKSFEAVEIGSPYFLCLMIIALVALLLPYLVSMFAFCEYFIVYILKDGFFYIESMQLILINPKLS
jgi:hypothetical protein